MNDRILAAIRSVPWAIMPGYLEAIEAMAVRALDHPAVQAVADDGHVERHFEAIAQMGERAAGTRSAAIRDGVGALPIFGPILPRAAMMSPSGGGAVALDLLAADFRALQADTAVRKILLVVDSPGGVTTDIAQFARMVAQSPKPVVAHVTGMGCSAAYWIISQAKEVSMDATAIVGSIGVMMGGSVQENPDQAGRRDIAIVSKNAPFKRPDLTTEDGRAVVQSTVDSLEDVFIAAIASGRGVSEAIVRSDFGQGGTLSGGPAVKARMADRIEADGLDGAIRRLATRNPSTRRTTAENTLKLAHARAGL
ncbi:S49 family peptidase [Sphingomonas sp. PP-CE-1G-424]|uniref:S49 family peptidase n=1 Tax=Sphingomonas sp. PP-CE-1G-424 TaxID=2135658 RepID=UPI0010547241|nr:S49 family peptidase [Sphingomonas sp. PP-CE-1G-424]TCP63851.1 ClpP class serine protease [Sphingomonas sp. PP-CE-1G-424]